LQTSALRTGRIGKKLVITQVKVLLLGRPEENNDGPQAG